MFGRWHRTPRHDRGQGRLVRVVDIGRERPTVTAEDAQVLRRVSDHTHAVDGFVSWLSTATRRQHRQVESA